MGSIQVLVDVLQVTLTEILIFYIYKMTKTIVFTPKYCPKVLFSEFNEMTSKAASSSTLLGDFEVWGVGRGTQKCLFGFSPQRGLLWAFHSRTEEGGREGLAG